MSLSKGSIQVMAGQSLGLCEVADDGESIIATYREPSNLRGWAERAADVATRIQSVVRGSYARKLGRVHIWLTNADAVSRKIARQLAEKLQALGADVFFVDPSSESFVTPASAPVSVAPRTVRVAKTVGTSNRQLAAVA